MFLGINLPELTTKTQNHATMFFLFKTYSFARINFNFHIALRTFRFSLYLYQKF